MRKAGEGYITEHNNAVDNCSSALLGPLRLYEKCLRIAPLWGKTEVLGKDQVLRNADGWMDG